MKRLVKLSEKDLVKIVQKVISEQSIVNLPSKGLKPVFDSSKLSQIKAQAASLAGNNLIITKVLQAMKQVDPEAYKTVTKGTDPLQNPSQGGGLVGASLISLIYTLTQEMKEEGL